MCLISRYLISNRLTHHPQPVCNEEGNVVGLLDITKVFHEALAKVERSSAASQKLVAALEGVHSELGGNIPANPQAMAMLAYVDALRDKTALPDLTTIIDSRTQPAMVTPKTSVRDAARLMKSSRTTAVCVMEGGSPTQQGRIAGIFTSKDIVLRVIAANLDPSGCSIIRVMTPHPDTAPPTMTVQDALKKMHSE
jgi:CBS domain containing-hemolysin-like protein